MSSTENRPSFRVLILIASKKLAEQAEEMFEEGALHIYLRMMAKGTASSEMMDILGFGDIDKTVLVTVMPTPLAEIMLCKLKQELKLGAPNTGIAFTVPLSGANSLVLQALQQFAPDKLKQIERTEETVEKTKHSMIIAMINQGYSDAVVDAARAAGATGGTVLNARCVRNEHAMNFWGFALQPERELVLIAADVENKVKIMTAIGEACGIHSDAQGLVVSIPIDSIIGLENPDR